MNFFYPKTIITDSLARDLLANKRTFFAKLQLNMTTFMIAMYVLNNNVEDNNKIIISLALVIACCLFVIYDGIMLFITDNQIINNVYLNDRLAPILLIFGLITVFIIVFLSMIWHTL